MTKAETFLSGARMVRVRHALLLLVAAGFVFLASTGAAWNEGRDAGLGLLPDAPRVVFAEAVKDLARSNRGLSSRELARIDAATKRAPLAAEPPFLHATDLLASGRTDEAMGLLEVARHRDPRLLPARILLAAVYLDRGKVEEAVREIGTLGRLRSGASPQLTALLASLVQDRRTSRQALAALRATALRPAVLQRLAGEAVSADLILDATPDLVGKAATDDSLGWVGQVILPYVAKGNLDSARRLWRHFYGDDLGGKSGAPYDGEFEGLPGGAPFGWDLRSGSYGLAEISGGALRVIFFGRDPAEAARQLLVLPPGAYQLVEKARVDEGKAGALRWQISCSSGAGGVLLKLAAGKPSPPSGQANRFTVPSDCSAQWLSLIAVPLPEIATEDLAVESLKIRSAGVP